MPAAAIVFCALIVAAPGLLSGQSLDRSGDSARTEVVSGPAAVILPIQVTAATVSHSAGAFAVPITVSDLTGLGIISFNFNILYDPVVIHPSGSNFGCSTTGTIAGNVGDSPLCNIVPTDTPGTLRVTVSGTQAMTGAGTILNVTFASDALAQPNDFSFLRFSVLAFYSGGGPAPDNVPSGPVATNINEGRYTISGPTAAAGVIGGRVTTSAGRPVSNVQVSLTDNAGLTRLVVSNPFGFFEFDDVLTGSTYILSGSAKNFTFQPRVVTLIDDLVSVDLVADQ